MNNNTWLHWRYKGFINLRATKVLNDLANKGDLIAAGYLKKFILNKKNTPSYLKINNLKQTHPITLNPSKSNGNTKLVQKGNEHSEIFITKFSRRLKRKDVIDYNKRIFSNERERQIYNNVPFFSLNQESLQWNFPLNQSEPNRTERYFTRNTRIINRRIKTAHDSPLHTEAKAINNVKTKIISLDNQTDMSAIRKKMNKKNDNKQSNCEYEVQSFDISGVYCHLKQ